MRPAASMGWRIKAYRSIIMDSVDFWTACASNGIVLDERQMANITRFHDELVHWNARVNLISRKDVENIYERHILHALCLLKYASVPHGARWLDVGTGGGFPGIPVKIVRPDVKMLLVDSIAKKVKVTKMLAQHTGLRHIDVQTRRAESLVDFEDYQHSFDIVSARAVAPLVQLASWTVDLLKDGGQILALKGGDLNQEITEARTKFPLMRIREIDIAITGVPWFHEQEKKLLMCTMDAKDAAT